MVGLFLIIVLALILIPPEGFTMLALLPLSLFFLFLAIRLGNYILDRGLYNSILDWYDFNPCGMIVLLIGAGLFILFSLFIAYICITTPARSE